MANNTSLSILRDTPLTSNIATEGWTSENFTFLSTTNDLSNKIVSNLSNVINTKLSTIADEVSAEVQRVDEISTSLSNYSLTSHTHSQYATRDDISAAINTLDSEVTGEAGAGKTLTSFSQTDGKVTAGFADIAITKSQVTDFPDIPEVDGKFVHLSGDTLSDDFALKTSDGKNFLSTLAWRGANNSLAIGYDSQVSSNYSLAVGAKSIAGDGATAVGQNAAATDASTAIGYSAKATGINATALGYVAKATGNYATALGNSAQATGNSATALGNSAQATSNYATALGRNAKATDSSATALGYNVAATGANSIQIGNFSATALSNNTADTLQIWDKPLLERTSGKIFFDRIPTGTTSTTVAVGDHTHNTADLINNAGFITSAQVDEKIDAARVKTMEYQGTVTTYADLPSSGNKQGDVWNVVSAYNENPPGTNYAWNGTTWDPLGGTIDVSVFATKEELNDLSVEVIDGLSNEVLPKLSTIGDLTIEQSQKINAISSTLSGMTPLSTTNAFSAEVFNEFSSVLYPDISTLKELVSAEVEKIDAISATYISGVIVNNTPKTVTNNVVDLGTVLTAHQSLSAYTPLSTTNAFSAEMVDGLSGEVLPKLSTIGDLTIEQSQKINAISSDLSNYALTSQIPTVNDGTLIIQKNGILVQSFNANQSNSVTANISVPLSTSQLSNDSGFITEANVPLSDYTPLSTTNDLISTINDELSGNINPKISSIADEVSAETAKLDELSGSLSAYAKKDEIPLSDYLHLSGDKVSSDFTLLAPDGKNVLSGIANSSRKMAIGYNAQAQATQSMALGYSAKTSDYDSVAVGYTSETKGYSATAVGSQSKATKDSATAIGANANASNTYAIAIGRYANASNTNAIAIGYSYATNSNAITIGHLTQATGANSIQIGGIGSSATTNSTPNTLQIWDKPLLERTGGKIFFDRIPTGTTSATVAVGDHTHSQYALTSSIPLSTSQLTNDSGFLTAETDPIFNNWLSGNSIAAGNGATAGNVGIAIGKDASSVSGVAIGLNCSSTVNGIAIGKDAKSKQSGIAIGLSANNYIATNYAGVAIGYDSAAYGRTLNLGYGTAIGYHAKAIAGHTTAIGDRSYASADGAIQLGIGTNNEVSSLQVYDWQLLDNNGNIPEARVSAIGYIKGADVPLSDYLSKKETSTQTISGSVQIAGASNDYKFLAVGTDGTVVGLQRGDNTNIEGVVVYDAGTFTGTAMTISSLRYNGQSMLGDASDTVLTFPPASENGQIVTKPYALSTFALSSTVNQLSNEVVVEISSVINPKLSTIISLVSSEVDKLDEISGKLDDYALTSDIPLSVSQLINDSGYITSSYVSLSAVEKSSTLVLTEEQKTALVQASGVPAEAYGDFAITIRTSDGLGYIGSVDCFSAVQNENGDWVFVGGMPWLSAIGWVANSTVIQGSEIHTILSVDKVSVDIATKDELTGYLPLNGGGVVTGNVAIQNLDGDSLFSLNNYGKVAIGISASIAPNAQSGVAIGANAYAANGCIAINGRSRSASSLSANNGGIAIGDSVVSGGYYSIQLGYADNDSDSLFRVWKYPMLDGNGDIPYARLSAAAGEIRNVLPISSTTEASIALTKNTYTYRVVDSNNTGTFPTFVAPTDIVQTGDYYFTFEIEWTTAASVGSYSGGYDWITYPEFAGDGSTYTYYIAGRWDSSGSGGSAFTLNCWRAKKLTA